MPNCRELAQDVRHAAVAQVGDVLLERQAQDADPRALDRPIGVDEQLDQLAGDVLAHAVVDPPAREDHLRLVAELLGLRGQVVRVDADAVAAHQARA